MSNLFILGNGFDIAHGLPTSYEDFNTYLKYKYSYGSGYSKEVPEGTMMPDGGIEYNDNNVVDFLRYIISNVDGEKWSDLENTLGFLDYSEFFDYISVEYDEDGDYDYFKNSYIIEDIASNLITPVMSITRFFSEWINTINIDNSTNQKNRFSKLINITDDLFLTFNYTKTLEKIYKIKNVCHIHGKQGEQLIVGHGNDNDKFEDIKLELLAARDSFQKIHSFLRKDTSIALENNSCFFTQLNNDISSIFSYGFSFSKVDQVYLKKICSALDSEEVIWYLNDYDNKKTRYLYKSIIKECGFKGKFDTYSTN